MRIVHISDLHYGKFSYNPLQIFSKRLLGNFNFLFKRQFIFDPEIIAAFEKTLCSLAPDLILVSGDLTTTALKAEFRQARALLERLSNNYRIFAIPGNHDTYTKSAFSQKLFYNSFDGLIPIKGDFKTDLKKDGVAIFKVCEHRYLLMLDCSQKTPYLLSTGMFSDDLERKLLAILSEVEKGNRIIVCCHYPFFNYDHPRRELKGAKRLQKIIEAHPQIDLYLHGHTHRHSIADLRESSLPFISDAGSLSSRKQATFNVVDIKEADINISPYYFKKEWKQHG